MSRRDAVIQMLNGALFVSGAGLAISLLLGIARIAIEIGVIAPAGGWGD